MSLGPGPTPVPQQGLIFRPLTWSALQRPHFQSGPSNSSRGCTFWGQNSSCSRLWGGHIPPTEKQPCLGGSRRAHDLKDTCFAPFNLAVPSTPADTCPGRAPVWDVGQPCAPKEVEPPSGFFWADTAPAPQALRPQDSRDNSLRALTCWLSLHPHSWGTKKRPGVRRGTGLVAAPQNHHRWLGLGQALRKELGATSDSRAGAKTTMTSLEGAS